MTLWLSMRKLGVPGVEDESPRNPVGFTRVVHHEGDDQDTPISRFAIDSYQELEQ